MVCVISITSGLVSQENFGVPSRGKSHRTQEKMEIFLRLEVAHTWQLSQTKELRAEHSCGLIVENPIDPESPSKSYGHSFAERSPNTLCHLGIRESNSLTSVFCCLVS